ncbi:MAG: amidohydrolase [Planctomycetes bacterium]|nr:amidohydrolase [Planctomycetota bacterium]MCH9724852.1 amidohydrolase [Planctomycetota bacterium]MCH9778792.1 amidohydrolase [Planctomycetota bacterium]MCH9793569.1 amidohydrolase [Planctomycetota bacterium]
MEKETIPRRSFLKTGVAFTAGAISAWPSTSSAKTENKIKYIDIHTHLGAFYHGQELTADLLIRFMDEHDVEKSCVLPLISPEAAPVPQPVSTAIDAYKKYPDRIIPFCVVDPRVLNAPPLRTGHVAGVKGLIGILKRYQDAGCKGLGEHKTGMLFDSTQNMYLYEACTSVGLPILFHLDDIRNIDTPGLPRLERVLKAFPKLPLIGHAAGFWASISADATREDFGRYPKIPSPVKTGGALDLLMSKYKNLFGDLSEPGGYRAIARDPKFGREFIIRNADQLLFGTDVLMPNQNIPHFKLFKSLNLPEEVQLKVYRGNAIKLLKLKTS